MKKEYWKGQEELEEEDKRYDLKFEEGDIVYPQYEKVFVKTKDSKGNDLQFPKKFLQVKHTTNPEDEAVFVKLTPNQANKLDEFGDLLNTVVKCYAYGENKEFVGVKVERL